MLLKIDEIDIFSVGTSEEKTHELVIENKEYNIIVENRN